jgi:hypothetical protein
VATSFTYQFSLGVGVDDPELVNPTMGASLAGLSTSISAPHADLGVRMTF